MLERQCWGTKTNVIGFVPQRREYQFLNVYEPWTRTKIEWTSLAPRVKREYRQIAKKRKSQDEVVPWADAAPPIVASGQRPAPLFHSSWMTDCNINSQYVPWLRYYAVPSQILVPGIILDFILQLLHDMTASLRCPLLATTCMHASLYIWSNSSTPSINSRIMIIIGGL